MLDAINAHMHPGTHCPTGGCLGECALIEEVWRDEEVVRYDAYLYLWDSAFTDSARVAAWFEAEGATDVWVSAILFCRVNEVANGKMEHDGSRPWVVGFALPLAHPYNDEESVP